MVSHSVNARFCENAVVVLVTVLSVQNATPFLYILPYQVTHDQADTLNSTVYVPVLKIVHILACKYVVHEVDHNAPLALDAVYVVHALGSGQKYLFNCNGLTASVVFDPVLAVVLLAILGLALIDVVSQSVTVLSSAGHTKSSAPVHPVLVHAVTSPLVAFSTLPATVVLAFGVLPVALSTHAPPT